MTDLDDLIERLREISTGMSPMPPSEGRVTCREAADALEALRAENERLREYHQEIIRQFSGVRGHVAVVIAKAALGDERMKAIADELHSSRAAITPR